MLVLNALLLFFLTPDCSMPVFINGFTPPKTYLTDDYKMTDDGFLLNLYDEKKMQYRIVELNEDGAIVHDIPIDPGMGLTFFCYLGPSPALKRPYGVASKGSILYRVGDASTTLTLLYDRSTKKISSVDCPSDWKIREFHVAGTHYFVTMAAGTSTDYRLLEVRLIAHGKGYALEPKGRSFSAIESVYGNWQTNFKHRWVVQAASGKLITAYQLSERLWKFSPEASKRVENDLGEGISLTDWVNPYLSDVKRQAPEEYKQWAFSFSHVAGLYRIGQDLLLAYNVPKDEESDDQLFTLYLQRMTEDGNLLGTPTKIPNGMLMGVKSDRETAYVYTREGGIPRICNFEF